MFAEITNYEGYRCETSHLSFWKFGIQAPTWFRKRKRCCLYQNSGNFLGLQLTKVHELPFARTHTTHTLWQPRKALDILQGVRNSFSSAPHVTQTVAHFLALHRLNGPSKWICHLGSEGLEIFRQMLFMCDCVSASHTTCLYWAQDPVRALLSSLNPN